MAVLWMVPIYSITSWLSLVWPKLEPFLAAVRDCYEAYAIYTFIGLLIAIIEDGRGLNGKGDADGWYRCAPKKAKNSA